MQSAIEQTCQIIGGILLKYLLEIATLSFVLTLKIRILYNGNLLTNALDTIAAQPISDILSCFERNPKEMVGFLLKLRYQW